MMQTIPKNQIEAKLGKGSFWLPKTVQGATYLQGIPDFDAIIASKPIATSPTMLIKILPGGLQVMMFRGADIFTVGIAFEDIKRVELEIPEDIVTKKERSVLGRAVVGGLLLGPVGAIVGGMSGLQEGKKVEAGDALLTIQLEQNGEESFFVGKVPKSKRNIMQLSLKNHLARFME